MEDKKDASADRGPYHIGRAVDQLLSRYRLREKFDQVSLTSAWPELVGKAIAKRTKKVFVRDRILFVEMQSPALKHQLSFSKDAILQVIQRRFGKGAVDKIVLL